MTPILSTSSPANPQTTEVTVGSISPTFANDSRALHDLHRLHDALHSAHSQIAKTVKLWTNRNLMLLDVGTSHLTDLAQAQAMALVINRLPAGAAGTTKNSLANPGPNDGTVVKIAPSELKRRNAVFREEIVGKGQTEKMNASGIYFPMVNIFKCLHATECFGLMTEAQGHSTLIWDAPQQIALNKAILDGAKPADNKLGQAYESALPYYAMAYQCQEAGIPLHHLRIARRLHQDLEKQLKNATTDAKKQTAIDAYQANLNNNVIATIPENKRKKFNEIWEAEKSIPSSVTDQPEKIAAQSEKSRLQYAQSFILGMFNAEGNELNQASQTSLQNFATECGEKGLTAEGDWFARNTKDFNSLFELMRSSYGSPPFTTGGAWERKNNFSLKNPLSNFEYAVSALSRAEVSALDTVEEIFTAIFGVNSYQSVPGYEKGMEKDPEKKQEFMQRIFSPFANKVIDFLDGLNPEAGRQALLSSSKRTIGSTVDDVSLKLVRHRNIALQATLADQAESRLNEDAGHSPSVSEQVEIHTFLEELINQNSSNDSKEVMEFLLDKAAPSTGMSMVEKSPSTQAILFKDLSPGASHTTWHFMTNADMHGMLSTKEEIMAAINTALSSVPGALHHAIDECIPIIAKYLQEKEKMPLLDPGLAKILTERLNILDACETDKAMSPDKKQDIENLLTAFFEHLRSYNNNLATKEAAQGESKRFFARLKGTHEGA